MVLAVCMLVAAALASMFGQGGGALYTPIQVWLGIGFHQAATTSLFLIVVMSVSASLVYRKANRIDWTAAMVLEPITAAGAFLGGMISEAFSVRSLSILFALVVASSAIFMLRIREAELHRKSTRRWFVWTRQLAGREYDVNLAIGLPASMVAGVLSGLLGVGGGILKVPMMVLLLGIPIEVAVGSSALMVGLTAAAGFGGHILQGHCNWPQTILLAAAVFVGAQIGSRISVRMDEKKLQRFFAWFLLTIALLMALKASA